jgi:hypothetical protein
VATIVVLEVICSVPKTSSEVSSKTYSTKTSSLLTGSLTPKSENAVAIVVPEAIPVITIGPSSLPIAPPSNSTVNVKVGAGVVLVVVGATVVVVGAGVVTPPLGRHLRLDILD